MGLQLLLQFPLTFFQFPLGLSTNPRGTFAAWNDLETKSWDICRYGRGTNAPAQEKDEGKG